MPTRVLQFFVSKGGQRAMSCAAPEGTRPVHASWLSTPVSPPANHSCSEYLERDLRCSVGISCRHVSVWLSVCVCLSQAGIVSKQANSCTD